MKTLKIVAAVIAGLIGIVLVVAAIAPKDYGVVREITIAKPLPAVYEYARLLKNQNHYSVWAKKDPSMVTEFRGEDGTVGFVSAWDSKMDDVGKGEQEITSIVEGRRIDYELRFIQPFESKDQAFMTFEPAGTDQTKVSWGFKGRMDFPMNLLLLVMDMEGMLGKDFSDGLGNLKTILEQRQ